MESVVPNIGAILEPGLFHVMYICLLGIPVMEHSAHVLGSVFLFPWVPHRYDGDRNMSLSAILEPGLFHVVYICLMGAPTVEQSAQALVAVFHFPWVPHSAHLVISTIQWNLSKPDTLGGTSMIYLFGYLLGALTVGLISDRCAIPGLVNDTYEVQNEAHESIINATIPLELLGGVWRYSQCEINDVAGDDASIPGNFTASTVACTSWVYDTSVFESSVTQEMDLVCDRKLLRAHASMIYLFGYLLGALTVGPISDRFGRKKTFCAYMTLETVMAISQAWAPNYASLVALRFFTGIGGSGMFVTFFVFVIEMTSPSKRAVFGVGLEYFWAAGITVLAVEAYLIRRWRVLQLVISLPNIIFQIYWWKLSESPRWLIQKGRLHEAEVFLRKINKMNKRDIDIGNLEKYADKQVNSTDRVWKLVTSRTLFSRTIIVWVNWMMVSMLFYGLALNVQNLGGDLYLNYLISCIMEFVAYTLGAFLIFRMRRKVFHCASMLIGGVSCVATLFPVIFGGESTRWLTITLAMIGRCGGTAAFACIYVFTAELYPTLFRNTAVGSSSVYARVGALLSPYIAELGNIVQSKVAPALPLMVFGGAAIFAGCLALLLPETSKTDLPDTVTEAKKMGRTPRQANKPAVYEEEMQTLNTTE